MGVDIGAAQWSYFGFAAFREDLARLEEIDLSTMAGYCRDGRPWSDWMTPLRPLLDHSDCDGSLTPAECAQVAPRLAELLPQLQREYDRVNGAKLVEEMRDAASNGHSLLFR